LLASVISSFPLAFRHEHPGHIARCSKNFKIHFMYGRITGDSTLLSPINLGFIRRLV
jgi:hypothetical protein